MSNVTITFDTDNAAYRNPGDESLNMSAVADTLRELADVVGYRTPNLGETMRRGILDVNGNHIGQVTIEEDPASCGDPDCGCDPVETDCCTVPRWTCQTTLIFDTAGDPDVRLCDPGYGCQEGQ